MTVNLFQLTRFQAFGNNTIGAPLLLEHPQITNIAAKMKCTPAQVLYVGISTYPNNADIVILVLHGRNSGAILLFPSR